MAKQLKKVKVKKDKNFVKETKPVISTDGEKIIWMSDKIDRSGNYAFNINRADFDHKEVLGKIVDYSSMTWGEVKRQTHDDGKSKHHFLTPGSLSKEAVERLKAKDLEEFSDYIFSFALQNKIRIIGIRNGEKFHVLWYDPDHEICPSKKRRT